MGTKHFRSSLTVALALVLLMVVGNAAAGGKQKKGAITLISPAANVVIAQNDPATGCPATATHPYGYTITFNWSDSRSLRNGATYTVQMQRAGATFPIVVQEGLTTSTYVFTDCNGFIIDSNLSNWSWEVIRFRGNGALATESAQRPFSFGPCRVSGGGACTSLPGG
jgi:hypothetical protein